MNFYSHIININLKGLKIYNYLKFMLNKLEFLNMKF